MAVSSVLLRRDVSLRFPTDKFIFSSVNFNELLLSVLYGGRCQDECNVPNAEVIRDVGVFLIVINDITYMYDLVVISKFRGYLLHVVYCFFCFFFVVNISHYLS